MANIGPTLSKYTGAAELSALLESDKFGIVSVKTYGAVGDGVTDDTAAIQAAADYCATNDYYLLGAQGTYKVTSTININCSGDLGEMTIIADSNIVSPVVRFGTTTGDPTSYKIITLPRVRNSNRTSGTWGNGVGIELANCNTNTITIPSVTEFEVGVTCGGYTSGFAYNNINLMFIYSNKINLRLKPAAIGGWCNQNVFTGGRLGINTNDFTTSGYVGTRNILLDLGNAAASGPNNNTFINTSLETSLIEYMIAFEQSASYNVFLNCRYEGTNKYILFNTDITSGINSNLFIGGYQAASLSFTYSGTGSSVYNSAFFGRGNSIESTGYGMNISNRSGDSESYPHIQGFNSSARALEKDASSTDWTYRIHGNGFQGKRSTDTYGRVSLDNQNGRVYLGPGNAALTKYLGNFGSSIATNVSFLPTTDDSLNLGDGSYRWAQIYAGNATINTSDERLKQDISEINNAEKNVAIKLKNLIKKYRFKEAVKLKNENARLHFGVVAQEVILAFESEGLDAMEYGIVCYDEWDEKLDEDGNIIKTKGNIYGIRYEELLCFIISAI